MAEGWRPRRDETPPESGDDDSERGEGALPAGAVESWRTWLLTGHSGAVSDPRRLRGSHRGLKQILVHGTGSDLPQSWKHFSGAMVRLAINDALNALPKDQTHVVWLAYFAGMSNRQIAARLGMSVGGVERRLKQAFESVSDYVEHGRTAGRRAVYGILGWFSLGRLSDALRQAPDTVNHAVMAGAVVVAGVSAAAIVGVATQPAATPGVHAVPITRLTVPAQPAPVVSTNTTPASQSIAATIKKAERSAAPLLNLPPLPSPPPLPLPSPPTLP